LGARIVARIGVKHSMLIAMPILILYFLGLRILPDWRFLFFILPIIRSFKMILYNYSFHLNFIEHSDKENRGKEISMTHASAVGASALSPFFGGLIISVFNFPVLFTIGSALLIFAVIPLFLTKENYEKLDFEKKRIFLDIFKKVNLPSTISFAGYAVESWVGFVIWPIFLFTILFSTESVGIIVSLTTVITLLVFYFIGKTTDKTDKRKLMRIGTLLYFFGWIGRAIVNNFISVFFVDTYKSITRHILYVPWSAYSYDLAAKANYFKFIVQREVTFNLIRVAVIPFLILVFAIGYRPFGTSFIIAALFSLLIVALNKKIA